MVLNRSYSRISGSTSLEAQTQAPGAAAASAACIARSCAPFAKLWRKQTATLSAPAERRVSTMRRHSAGSRARSTLASWRIRSSASSTWSLGTNDAGLSVRML